MTIKEYGIQAIKDEAQAVLALADKIDDHFEQAVNLMFNCKGKVIVTGVGKSGHIGAKIAATLSSTGTPSFFVNPLDVFHGDLGVMTPDDVVLAISNSGQTDELLRFVPMVLHMGLPIIGMTGNPRLAACKILYLLSQCRCRERSVSTESGAYQFYNGTTRYGRCFGSSTHREAPLSSTRLRTLPSRWRTGQATAHHSQRRDAQ